MSRTRGKMKRRQDRYTLLNMTSVFFLSFPGRHVSLPSLFHVFPYLGIPVHTFPFLVSLVFQCSDLYLWLDTGG